MTSLMKNQKALFDYEIMEKYEAGLELLGFEVKSLKGGHGSLDGAHVIIDRGQAFVLNMLIPPYQEKNTPADYDPRRNRRLILSKKEIQKIAMTPHGQNLTIVPISLYTKNNRIKVELALVRGKKKYDKRESIKRRETNREMEREMKGR